MKNTLDKNIEAIVCITNRSVAQTKFLLDILNGDLLKLIRLEYAIKYLIVHYCPSDIVECEIILAKYEFRLYMNEKLGGGFDKHDPNYPYNVKIKNKFINLII